MESDMSSFFQVFLPALLNISVSFIICVSLSLFLLSSGIQLEPIGSFDNSWQKSFMLGAVAGILHGLITAAVIYRYKPASTAGHGISAVIATEVLLLAAITIIIIRYLAVNDALKFPNIGAAVPLAYMGFMAFLVSSAILIIPSFMVGLLTGKIQQVIFSKIILTYQ
jgi:hypothetical protein